MKLIVGLGNPGEKYKNTRHNLGFMVADEISAKWGVQSAKWEYKEKFKSEILYLDSSLSTDHLSLILARPQTYVNESGLAVLALANFFKITPEDIIVIHDDLDLPLGKIKVRLGGSGAGHHGVESVIKSLGTDQFVRVRLGIGNEKSHAEQHKRLSFHAERFVLEKFPPKERSVVKTMIKQGIKALEVIFDQGLEVAQNQFN